MEISLYFESDDIESALADLGQNLPKAVGDSLRLSEEVESTVSAKHPVLRSSTLTTVVLAVDSVGVLLTPLLVWMGRGKSARIRRGDTLFEFKNLTAEEMKAILKAIEEAE